MGKRRSNRKSRMAGAKKRQTNLKDNASKVSRKGKMMRVSAGVLSVLLCLVAVGYKLWLDGAFTKLPPGNLRVGNQAQPKQAAKRKSYENVADLSDEHFFEREEKHKDVFDKDYMKLDGVIFENLSSQTVQLWWANPTGHDALQGTLKPSETFTVNTWMGHNFYFTPEGTKGTMEDSLYSVMMESTARIVLYDEMERTAARSRFNREHFHRTGREWKNFWPREPVTHPYHRAKIGEKIVKESDRSQFFVCIDDQLDQETISALDAMEEMSEWDPKTNPAPPAFQVENDGYFIGRMNGTTYCREKMDPEQLLSWDLINICDQGPNAFRIYNFISDDEIEHIKNLGMDLGMTRSTQGAEKIMSATRTSQTVWIDRDASFIVDNIVRRIADMVNIPQQKLFLNASAESLQLVHYFGGEMYKAHHDYTTEEPHNRYITFLMYLNDVSEGGNTSFPNAHASCKNEDGYLGVQPIKGSVAWFYDLLPDGNADESTLHFAEPPVDSEKWMTNLWIWDKIFVPGDWKLAYLVD